MLLKQQSTLKMQFQVLYLNISTTIFTLARTTMCMCVCVFFIHLVSVLFSSEPCLTLIDCCERSFKYKFIEFVSINSHQFRCECKCAMLFVYANSMKRNSTLAKCILLKFAFAISIESFTISTPIY